MVPPSNDNKATYTVSLRWLSNPVFNICSFWPLLIIRVQTRGKNHEKGLPIFPVQQILSIVTLAVKTKPVVLEKVLSRYYLRVNLLLEQFWTL